MELTEVIDWLRSLNGSLRPDSFVEGIPLFLGICVAQAVLTCLFLRKEIAELRREGRANKDRD